jgi:hypothetical protein
LDLLRASLSPQGYTKVVGCTFTNHFLGELVNGLMVLNRHSYNLRLFLPRGEKATAIKLWGYSFFGHHLCIAVAFAGKTMVIGPTFMGAEPDRIDVGPHKGLRLFNEEETRGLQLMRSLSPENHKKALLCEGMNPKEGLGDDRWNPFDERHLGGARQDNRIVPFGECQSGKVRQPEADRNLLPCVQEGCPISDFTSEQREEVYQIIRYFNIYLPDGPLRHRMELVRSFEDQTYFSWIGKDGLGDPYYYRIHSPVTFCEVSQRLDDNPVADTDYRPSRKCSLTFIAGVSVCLHDDASHPLTCDIDSLSHQHIARQVPHPHNQSAAKLWRLRQSTFPLFVRH